MFLVNPPPPPPPPPNGFANVWTVKQGALWSIYVKMVNRPFAASHSRGTKPPCWRAKVALGQDK